MDRPIHDALVSLWEELLADDKYEMKEVLLVREQQRDLHMEMADGFNHEQGYHLIEQGRWTWRNMPIILPEEMSTGYSRHVTVGEGQPMPGISCRVLR